MTSPKQLGKYQIEARVGEGGMGVVYRAFDPALQQAVAIKVIRKELVEGCGGHLVRLRFKNEAIAGRRLRHPNIAPVYDYGEDHDCSFIVMDWVEGRQLKDVLESGHRFTLSEVLSITEQLLEALDYAHRRNVVHRDIKPSNILYGEAGQIQVVDFGIAKIESSTLTMTGAILGTPGYMAPEQCQGTPSDHRADIFAAGVILYELLTGERPFRASTGIATLQQALSLEPIKPSQLNVQCTPALDAIVARAMAKRREERYQSAREFIEALKQLAHATRSSIAVAASVPTIAGTVLDAAAQGKTTKRKGVLVTAGSVALVALAVISFSVGKERVAPQPDPPMIEKIGLLPERAEALTPKPPPRGEDNAGAVESATLDSLNLQLGAIVERIECAELKPSVTSSREVVLAGYLKPEDRKRVEQELARLPGVTSVLFKAETLAWPYCELRGLLGAYESANHTRRDQFGEPSGVSLASSRPEARYQEGEHLVLTLTAPDRDSFLYVDYFLLDGSVVHLFPLTASQRKPQRAGAGITLGQAGGGSTREWQVSSPFGSEMLVAVATQEPLFAAPRPEMDTSKDYLPLLAQALEQARSKGAMVLADLLPITTSAAAEADSEFVKKSSRAKGGRVPPERRTVSRGAKRSASPEGASLRDETSNRSVY